MNMKINSYLTLVLTIGLIIGGSMDVSASRDNPKDRVDPIVPIEDPTPPPVDDVKIRGTVTDDLGEKVPNVKVTFKIGSTTRTAYTNTNGYYFIYVIRSSSPIYMKF